MKGIKSIYRLWARFIFGNHLAKIPLARARIEGYKVENILLHEKGSDIFVVVLKDRKNKRFVAKIWLGEKHNFSYDSLKREYLVYTSLHRTIKSLRGIPVEFSRIYIPKLISFKESTNQAVLIIEYIEGVTALHLDAQRFVKEYFRVCDYFEFLGEHATDNDAELFGKKSYLYLLSAYPLFLLKAAVTNPSSLKTLTLGLNDIISLFQTSFKSQHGVLIHGDLNLDNIIISKNKVYLIDFQFSTFSYREYGYANTLRFLWDKNFAKDEFVDTLSKKTKNGQIDKQLLRSTIVIHGTQGLMADNFSRKTIKAIENYLRYGLRKLDSFLKGDKR